MLPYPSPFVLAIYRYRATVPVASLVHLSWSFFFWNHPHSGAKQTSSDFGVSSPSLLPHIPTENGLTWEVVTGRRISFNFEPPRFRNQAYERATVIFHSISLTTQIGLAWAITTDEAGAFSHRHTHFSCFFCFPLADVVMSEDAAPFPLLSLPHLSSRFLHESVIVR